jgi:hypothetical protein
MCLIYTQNVRNWELAKTCYYNSYNKQHTNAASCSYKMWGLHGDENSYYERFEVLIVKTLKIIVHWDVRPCSPVQKYQSSGGKWQRWRQQHPLQCRSLSTGTNAFHLSRKKVKVHPRTSHKGPEGEERYSSNLSLTLALDGGRWSAPRPGRFNPRKRPGTHCTGGWVSPRAGLDRCG